MLVHLPSHRRGFLRLGGTRAAESSSVSVGVPRRNKPRRRLTRLDASAPLTERIHTVLLEGLPSGESSVEITARRLGLSSRTLQRRLKLEGTSYKEVVRLTRERLARHYVCNTKLAYAEISFLIGFEEPGSFFRAFREWTGETPETVRLAAGA